MYLLGIDRVDSSFCHECRRNHPGRSSQGLGRPAASGAHSLARHLGRHGLVAREWAGPDPFRDFQDLDRPVASDLAQVCREASAELVAGQAWRLGTGRGHRSGHRGSGLGRVSLGSPFGC